MPEQSSTASTCEVLVVGAGPTGLMAACLLKSSGVNVRIIEQRAEPSSESRAFAIQARSMELFENMGIVDAFLERGVINPGVEFYVGGDHVGGLNFDRAASPDTAYPFIFMLPQSETERILIDELTRLGVQIEREVSAVTLEQDSAGVSVQTSAGDMVRCAYVIGADGAHSTVRKSLGLPFEGGKYPQTFLLADCRVSWKLDHARFRVFMNGESTGLFLPLDGERRSRVMATDLSNKADSDAPDRAELDLEELETAFANVTGMEVTLADPVWTTRYRINHRGVDTYQKGRMFVAGDAAHIHSPAGGQGMNTGLQDAANLAWKLAAVLRHGAAETLLTSYDAERRPVGEQVVATSDKLFDASAGMRGFKARVRDVLVRPAATLISKVDLIQHKAFRKVSELDIPYEGDFLEDASHSLKKGPKPGQRAPNAAISRQQDVLDLIKGYGFSVLALSRKPLERGELSHIKAELEQLTSKHVTPHLIARLSVGRDPRAVFVSSVDVFKAYGLSGKNQQGVYLVRPDGYVAWRGDGLDITGCKRFLSHFGLGHPVAESVAA